ncbi:RIP metalloprotease RseP [Phaeobacter sp. HS012]|uniref:RIP metalloprotease RseP n=1 Tax=Phaeobacter TaxID=302485 RepID=UPI000C9B022C|nr:MULTISPECIES: RIP metalloprotease RseP [Phaeobacter]AUQ58360.1 peptidase M50 [Phaeobacter inhibens]AUR07640.1 peptidase M50 [Phaeobacter inhibens]AUR11479.1 peptidase M50 [Phaeobacter inhibens]MBQ4806767.1 RIP metalloprotease RseP [Phaeobacter sp. HS012]MBQ4881617.1 RIP metalloprotease RseP [Phaeobacter sp. HS011]
MDFVSFLPQLGGYLYVIASFVVALSVIVAVHEYGHYIVGRWSGIHAEVFSLGFGPVLFSRVDKRGTRWQVALLPFGGYVKFLGDADAASGKDADAMADAAADPVALRRTMHGAPLWARSATVAAGPVFNFIMSALIFAGVFMLQGTMRDPLTVERLVPLPGLQTGLREGDALLQIEGVDVPSLEDGVAFTAFRDAVPEQQPLTYTVLRDEREVEVEGPYPWPPHVRGVAPRSAAADIDLQPGDVITAVDGAPIFAFDQLKRAVESAEGKVLLLDVWRAGEEFEMALAPRRVDEPQPEGGFATRWRMGIAGGLAFDPATEAVGIGEALGGGAAQVWGVVEMSLSGLGHMITGAISTCNLSGPIGIAETSGAMASQGAESFIRFIAVLSTAVGLLNLFPIPALDGGHLVFYAYEAVTGRPPNDAVMRILMSVGIAAILSLMMFALFNDIFC